MINCSLHYFAKSDLEDGVAHVKNQPTEDLGVIQLPFLPAPGDFLCLQSKGQTLECKVAWRKVEAFRPELTPCFKQFTLGDWAIDPTDVESYVVALVDAA
jgi:hypothetical protein